MFLIVALFLLLPFTGNWYLTDRLGSVTGITDATGALINSTTYDSYGHILSQSNPAVADALGFTGREFDTETGLYYFRARYYNPDLGKFQSEDPLGFESGEENLTRYADNNPIAYLDPYGLQTVVEKREVEQKNGEKLTISVARTEKEAAQFQKDLAEAEKAYAKKIAKCEEHHLLPKYLGGIDEDVNLASIPAAYHQLITNSFRSLAPYGESSELSAEEIQKIVDQVYQRFPIPPECLKKP